MSEGRTGRARLYSATDELAFWCAVPVMAYSLLVPLFALDSMISAQRLLQFSPLHQLAMLVSVLLGVIRITRQLVTHGWSSAQSVKIAAVLLLLAALQPSPDCCAILIAVIAGAAPWSEISAIDVAIYLTPVLGSALLMVTNAPQA